VPLLILEEYNLLRRIQNLPMPKHTCLPIVRTSASFSASSTYHIVLEALEPGELYLPDCPHRPLCYTAAGCPYRQSALRKVASQLLLGLSVLHEKMGYVHGDLKPENILKCQASNNLPVAMVTVVSPDSMKLKMIDLGNAIPIEHTNIYYSDFEVQSIHYRAPEVCDV
jgi:serine/threonine protein kinase